MTSIKTKSIKLSVREMVVIDLFVNHEENDGGAKGSMMTSDLCEKRNQVKVVGSLIRKEIFEDNCGLLSLTKFGRKIYRRIIKK